MEYWRKEKSFNPENKFRKKSALNLWEQEIQVG